jgi:hypothetical protein
MGMSMNGISKPLSSGVWEKTQNSFSLQPRDFQPIEKVSQKKSRPTR